MNSHLEIQLTKFFFCTKGLTSKDAEYKLAQSGDATCNGLESAEVIF